MRSRLQKRRFRRWAVTMHPFLLAAIGGVLIGLAAVILMATTGRIAGISGIAGGLLPPKPAPDRAWRIAFLLGLIAAPFLMLVLSGSTGIGEPAVGVPQLLTAGLLVGVGTALGAGCTSGHGICGISRLSPRSFVAVMTFMAAAIVTVFIVRHAI
jgi:uncharacterized membrane protein YedE/YeeE